ncbi:MAG: hypothetical protein U0822_14275 [Anaerolineae bacterium]
MRDREDQDTGRMGNLTERKREGDNMRDERAAGGSSGPSTSSESFDSAHRNQYGGHTGDEAGMTDSAHHSGDVKTRGANDMSSRQQGSSDMDDDMETGGGGAGRRREFGNTGGAGSSGDMGSSGSGSSGGMGSSGSSSSGGMGSSGSSSSGGMGSSGSGSSGGMGGSTEGNEG